MKLTFGMAIPWSSETISRNLGYLLVVAVGLYAAEHTRCGIKAK